MSSEHVTTIVLKDTFRKICLLKMSEPESQPSRPALKKIAIVEKIKVPRLGVINVKERPPATGSYFSINAAGEVFLNTKTKKTKIWSSSGREDKVKDDTVYRFIRNGVVRE